MSKKKHTPATENKTQHTNKKTRKDTTKQKSETKKKSDRTLKRKLHRKNKTVCVSANIETENTITNNKERENMYEYGYKSRKYNTQ